EFDRDDLPAFSRLVVEPEREYDLEKGKFVVIGQKEYLVERFGYLTHVLWKMVETIEMALWGTLLALVVSLPLAWFSARGYTWNRVTYVLARGVCSLSRALPELIVAMFCVLLFGFGTIPGVLALGFHCSGFFGKFFADDIENADQGPQDAIRSTGAGQLKVLRYAVLPQVTPQFLAYIQYILERNVRTATILGIVGAGGIGLELKGRLDLSDYSHVSTTLLVIFLTVFLLEQLTQRARSRLIGSPVS
ncbi:MAG: phosphonate ABC transporter, permease protein PhnE, partial [Planctomycetaceae bacterium]